MPKVSIIIPVYNVEKYLRQSLDSAINQTLKDIEIICVDDCSTDSSSDILKEYAEKDSRIAIIKQEVNEGLSSSRNVAMKIAKGDYIMFLDSDDWLELDACEKLYNQISKYNNDFVVFNINKYYESKGTKKEVNRLENFAYVLDNHNTKVSDLDINFLKGAECWYKIYNRDFLINNNIFFEGKKYEDSLFSLKIFIFAKSISFLNGFFYNYRKRNDSITGNYDNNVFFIQQNRACFEYLKKNNIENKEKYIYAKLITGIRGCGYIYRKSLKNKKASEKFYKEMHKFFKELNKEYDISKIEQYIDYEEFNKVLKRSLIMQKIINYLHL